MKVLLVSSSARGHAIADALHRSPQKPEIISICVNRNPGIRKIAARSFVQNIMDFPAIVEIAKQEKPNFAFIGPDDPIGAGLADVLQGIGIPSVAPKKKLAQVETSKGFTRELLQKYNRCFPKADKTLIPCVFDGSEFEWSPDGIEKRLVYIY